MKSWPRPSSLRAAGEPFVIDRQLKTVPLEETCVDIASNFIAAAGNRDKTLHAFTEIDADRLMSEAAALDALPTHARGPLYGTLVAVKEVYDVTGYTCAWGTPVHKHRVPSKDADAVAILREAGAMIAGITVSTEYALSRTGPTVNPYDGVRTPGASSQGSAAAVGAGLVPLALGSQTIGSVIRPAAFCGCVGVKPTWGAIPVGGSMPLSAPLDHVGLLAADVAMAIRALSALAPDLEDVDRPARLIYVRPWYHETLDADVREALDASIARAAARGFDVSEKAIPEWIGAEEEEVLDTLLAGGMAQNHGRDFDCASAQMSPRVCDYIERGRAQDGAVYAAALHTQDQIATELDAFLGDAVAIMPATTGVAPMLDSGTGSRAPQRLWSLAGCPAVTVSVGKSGGLPIGVQLVGARHRDHAVLAVAAQLAADPISD